MLSQQGSASRGRRISSTICRIRLASLLVLMLMPSRLAAASAGLRGGERPDPAGELHPTYGSTAGAGTSAPLRLKGNDRRRAQMIEVLSVPVSFTLAISFVDEETAALLETFDPNPVVSKFCSAVNTQAGGSQARKSAENDALTLFTQSDMGCQILGTNRMYTYGTPPLPNLLSLEVQFRQDVFVSPTGNESLAEIVDRKKQGGWGGDVGGDDLVAQLVPLVTLHSAEGFEKGSGGRAKFRKWLREFPAFQYVEDVEIIDGLSPPMARPTAAPPAELTGSPARPTVAPTRVPTAVPTTPYPTVPPSPPPKKETAEGGSALGVLEVTLAPTTAPAPEATATSPSVTGTTGTPPPAKGTPATETATPTRNPAEEPTEIDSTNDPFNEVPSDPRDQIDSVQNHSQEDDGSGGPEVPTAAIAAAAGAGVGILAVGLFTLYRCKMDEDDDKQPASKRSPRRMSPPTLKKKQRHSSGRPPWPLGGRRSPPSSSLEMPAPPSATSSVARLGAKRAPLPVPSVVAVNESGDVGSVAESTLGDRTAGRKPAPPRPPVHIIKGAARVGARSGGGASSVAASSQISSLGSGTIGAGGDHRTLGGFSLEAAIMEEDTYDGEELIGNGISVPRAIRRAHREGSGPVDLDDSVIGVSILSAADASGEGQEPGKKLDREALRRLESRTAVVDDDEGTPDESLGGPDYARMSVSFKTKADSKDGDLSEGRDSTPQQTETTVDSAPASDSEATPRSSGAKVRGLNIDLEDGMLLLDHTASPPADTYLPKALSPHGAEEERVASPPPPSISARSMDSRASSSTWSDVFAGGTAAILSASFHRFTDPHGETDSESGSELRMQPMNPSRELLLPPPVGDATEEQAPVPAFLEGGKKFPKELAGSRTFPPEFPDSGPLVDAPSSDVEPDTPNLKICPPHQEPLKDPPQMEDSPSHESRSMVAPRAPGEAESEGRNKDDEEPHPAADDTQSNDSSVPPPPPALPPSPDSFTSLKIAQEVPAEYAESEVGSAPPPSDVANEMCLSQQDHGAHGSHPIKELTVSTLAYGSDAGVSSLGPHSEVLKTDVVSAALDQAARLSETKDKFSGSRNGNIPTPPVTPTPTSAAAAPASRDDIAQSPLTPDCPRDDKQDTASVGERSSSSSTSSGSENLNPWLLDAISDTLGPRSKSADIESFSGRSHWSGNSGRSGRTGRSGSRSHGGGSSDTKRVSPKSVMDDVSNGEDASPSKDAKSVGSKSSKHTTASRRSQGSQYSAQSIASDLLRLETQLSTLGEKDREIRSVTSAGNSAVGDTSSEASLSAAGSSSAGPGVKASSLPPRHRSSARNRGSSRSSSRGNSVALSAQRSARVDIPAPPGRLGVILANRSDRQGGTVVSALRASSPLAGQVKPGDWLEAIDGEDVSELRVSDVTAIMAARADRDRVLTIVPRKIRLSARSEPETQSELSSLGDGDVGSPQEFDPARTETTAVGA